MNVGPVENYQDIYTAACGETFPNRSLGKSHEDACCQCRSFSEPPWPLSDEEKDDCSDEWIDHDWLNEWATKCDHTWEVSNTGLHVHRSSTYPNGMWLLFQCEADSEETSLCYVRTRGELIRTLERFIPEDEPEPDCPNWHLMTESQKDEALRKSI